MKKWICVLLALLLLGCVALAEAGYDAAYDDYAYGEYEEEAPLLDSVGVRIAIAAGVALIIAFARVSAMKAKLQTAHSRSGASDYAKEGSFELGVKQDRFLYERTERRRVQTSQPSSGGGRPQGGGSARGGGASRAR